VKRVLAFLYHDRNAACIRLLFLYLTLYVIMTTNQTDRHKNNQKYFYILKTYPIFVL